METYIVRIYRFEEENPRSLVGIVESVEGGRRERRSFTGFEDLWEILNARMLKADVRKKPVRKLKAPEPAISIDVTKRKRRKMKVTIDARRLSKAERTLLTGYAVKKVGRGEIVMLADNVHVGKDISQAAENDGWSVRGIESQGDSCRITISRDWR